MDFDKLGFWDINIDGKIDMQDVLLIDDYEEFNNDQSCAVNDWDDDESDEESDIFDEEEEKSSINNEDDIGDSFANVGDTSLKHPILGHWKYYDGSIWNIENALIDHFVELQENYDTQSYNDLCEMIAEIYYYDPQKAVEYLRWVIECFPSKDLDNPDEFVNYNYHLRVTPISNLFNECTKDNGVTLLDAMEKDDVLLNAFLKQVTWEKHNLSPLANCMSFYHMYGMFEKSFSFAVSQLCVGKV